MSGEKLKKVGQEAQSLLKAKEITAWTVSRVMEKMSSMMQAILPALLFFKHYSETLLLWQLMLPTPNLQGGTDMAGG